MGKKKKQSLSFIYLVGMLLVVIGFVCPIFKVKILGSFNGFDFMDFDSFGFVTIGSLCIFIGALLGAILTFTKSHLGRLIALILTIVGGIILFIGINENEVYKLIAKGFFKNAFIGFYFILVGWVLGLVGWILKK